MALSALAAAILAAIIASDFSQPAQAQTNDQISGRIIARQLADGRVEFGWLPAGTTQRVPLHERYFPAEAPPNRWLRSSPVSVAGIEIGRIDARRLSDRRIEFAFVTTDDEYIQPERRYFPADVDHSRWLYSTVISVPILGPGPDDSGLTPSRAEKKNLLVERLFGLQPGTADALTKHDLNDWGCGAASVSDADCNAGDRFYRDRVDRAAWNAYEGGHSGWDVSHTARRPTFYSLTEGFVIAAGGGNWPCNDIAVYDENAEKTTIYLHAATVLVRVGDPVSVGTPLGTEGTRCRGTVGEHIHLEVRDGKAVAATGGRWNDVRVTSRIYARGAGQTAGSNQPATEYSVDPLPYLFQATCGDFGSAPTSRPSADGRSQTICSSMLVRDRTSPEIYVFKTKDGKQFRRHVVTAALYDEVPGWTESAVQSVSAGAFRTIRESPLVWLPGEGGDVYAVYEVGEDDIVLRHIPDADAFNRAGCDWDGVFAMSAGEYDYWADKLGAALRGPPIDAAFRCPR